MSMGQIAAAAVVSHQPSIMQPEEVRRAMNDGVDTTLVAGFAEIRAALDAAGVDTLAIVDTHWFTTATHVVAGGDRYAGTYTSDELPTVIADLQYDFRGAPELAALVAEAAGERRVPLVNTTSPHIAIQYPTLNVVHHLGWEGQVLRVGTCQHAEPHNFFQLGEVLAAATERSDARVGVLASGGLSHRFPPMDKAFEHIGFGPGNVITPEARAFDEKIVDLWCNGDHATVIDLYPDLRAYGPEGGFGHYLTMAGALGGRQWRALGRQMSAYENALGTGQVHVWFDLPAARGVAR
jgi:3,4-dihydroxyphenylacetate 2,3-dioxygenase